LSVKEIESKFEGAGYGDFKAEVGDKMAEYISPIRERYLTVREDKNAIKEILKAGREKANIKARKTLSKVYKKVGFVQL
jgi:tryptophanyl-tRNA synthetase